MCFSSNAVVNNLGDSDGPLRVMTAPPHCRESGLHCGNAPPFGRLPAADRAPGSPPLPPLATAAALTGDGGGACAPLQSGVRRYTDPRACVLCVFGHKALVPPIHVAPHTDGAGAPACAGRLSELAGCN